MYSLLTWKRALFYCGVILIVLFTSCVVEPYDDDYVHNLRYSASEDFSFQLSPNDQTRFTLDAINGTVEIIGRSDRNIVEIWGERIAESDSRRDAENYLDRLDVEVTQRTEEIFVQTLQPNDTHGRNLIVHYFVRIPKSWDVEAYLTNGEMTIKNLTGYVDAELTNGEFNLESVANTVDINMTNGNMFLNDVRGSVDADVTNGNIDTRMILPAFGTCNMNTVNGQIRLYIPESTSAEFSANVTNGTISLNNLDPQDLQSTLRSKSGVLGSGEGEIDLKTVNGNIIINGL